jgi:hypothetical protein
MWTRGSIHNQFDEEIRRMFQLRVFNRFLMNPAFTDCSLFPGYRKHAFLPSVAYIILDGPFRDNLIKIGYDPRTDPSVYLYVECSSRKQNHSPSDEYSSFQISTYLFPKHEGRTCSSRDNEQSHWTGSTLRSKG